MIKYAILAGVFVLLVASCTSAEQSPGEKPGGGAGMAACGDVLIGEPVAHKNLAVFPLYLKTVEEIKEDYITLEEALKEKKVEVREVGAAPEGNAPPSPQPEGQVAQPAQQQAQELVQQEVSDAGTVNAVEIENKSKRPIYILAGQVIIGGKQDRVIAKDTVVPPGEKIQVEVCCVEHGRWSPRDGFAVEGLVFNGAASGNVTASIKTMTQAGGHVSQSGVWEEVAKQADKLNADTETGTYKEVLEVTEKNMEEYLAAFKSFAKDTKICGFVVCINGEVVSCDLFAAPKLLAKFRDFQLRSYALDAMNTGEDKEAKETTVAAVKDFLEEMEKAGKNREKLAQDKHRRVDKLESERVIGFDNAPCIEGYYKQLHRNAYSK